MRFGLFEIFSAYMYVCVCVYKGSFSSLWFFFFGLALS